MPQVPHANGWRFQGHWTPLGVFSNHIYTIRNILWSRLFYDNFAPPKIPFVFDFRPHWPIANHGFTL